MELVDFVNAGTSTARCVSFHHVVAKNLATIEVTVIVVVNIVVVDVVVVVVDVDVVAGALKDDGSVTVGDGFEDPLLVGKVAFLDAIALMEVDGIPLVAVEQPFPVLAELLEMHTTLIMYRMAFFATPFMIYSFSLLYSLSL